MRKFILVLLFLVSLSGGTAVVPAVPIQKLELQPGWNLMTLEGAPLQPEKFVVLKPMVFDTTRRSYILCTIGTELKRGTAVWIYCAKAQSVEVPLVAASVTGQTVAPASGWSMVGATGAAPSWLSQVALPFFRWDAPRGFVPAATPEAGKGYWVKKQ